MENKNLIWTLVEAGGTRSEAHRGLRAVLQTVGNRGRKTRQFGRPQVLRHTASGEKHGARHDLGAGMSLEGGFSFLGNGDISGGIAVKRLTVRVEQLEKPRKH